MSFVNIQDQGSDKIFYRQCRLEEQIPNLEIYYHEEIVWIPEKFAKLYNIITLKQDNYSRKWKVMEIFGRRSEKELLSTERDYMTQRLVSDV